MTACSRMHGKPVGAGRGEAGCLAAMCLVLLLAACGEPRDNVIRFGLASAPNNLDPRYATDAASTRLNRLLYQRLVDFDASMQPVPSLARWERVAPTQYRFHLKQPRPHFHDGTPVTAHDVAATYRSILAPGSVSPHAGSLRLVKRIEVLDDNALDFFLDRADPLFPGFVVIGILPAAGIAADYPFHSQPLGSGPFSYAGQPEAGRWQLRRQRDGQLIEFLRVGDPTVRILKLVRGEIDLLQNDLPPELLSYLEGQDDIVLQTGVGSNFAYLGFNLQDPATRDHRVRLAIAHAIDREPIIRHVLGGAARKAATLLPPEHWAGDAGLTAPGHDPARSRALLQQAGYDDRRPLQLVYKTSTDPVRIRIATVLQQQLADVGIRMDLRSYDWGTFFGDIKAGRFQVYSLMWVGIKTPDIFRHVFHSRSLPPGGANRGRYADDLTDRHIVQAEQAATLQAQAVHWRAVQARLLETLPYVPLWYEDHVAALGSDIRHYKLSLDGSYDSLVHVSRAR